VGQVAPDIPTEDQIGHDAFNFIQIHWHTKPLEGIGHVMQRYLMFFQDDVNSFEEISIADYLALFQHQIRPLANEAILVLHQTILKCTEVTFLNSFHQWFELV
jgi:hypothetical protein